MVWADTEALSACAEGVSCRKILTFSVNNCCAGARVTKFSASLIHFTLSLAVFAVLLVIILLVWYPGLLFEISGGWEGLRIVIAVDLVLGPLLTLVVYRAGKPSLTFDLSCIAIFQIVCLGGGVWVVYNERPVVLAIEYDSIFSLNAREFASYGNTMESLEQFSGPYPKLVYIELPQDDQEAMSLSTGNQLSGEPLFGYTSNYLPLVTDSYIERSRFRREFALRNGVSQEIQNQINDHDCVFSRFTSVSKQGFVCFDLESLSITEFFENDSTAAR
ncbi:MAG: hypothetical protein ACI9WR_001372 [Paracoccaceae bacterium]|jgi:hypothetical protein